MPEDVMFQEAMGAIREGEIQRARDLLTRLLKADANKPAYWMYMSAVVETPKERIFCLQEVLKREPDNRAARRGLIMLGALPPEEGPRPPMTRRKWQSALAEPADKSGFSARKVIPRLVLIGGGAVLAIALIVIAITSVNRRRNLAFMQPVSTLKPSATYLPTPSPVVRTLTPTYEGPRPLWMSLEATYTPTPMYVNTPHPVSEAYRTAIRHLQMGDLPGALTFMQQAAVTEPDSADIYYQIGEIYRQMDQNQKALDAYNQSINLNRDFAPAYLGRAQVELDLDPGNKDADLALSQAMALDPNLNEAPLVQAAVFVARGDGQSALDLLDGDDSQLAVSPLYYLYRAQAELLVGQKGAALVDATKANQMDLTMLDGYYVLAEAYQANDQIGKALEPLKTYTIYVTNDPNAWVLLGAAYFANHQDDAAQQAFSRALELNSRLFDAYLQRGLIYLDRGDGAAALNDLDTATKLDANSFDASLGKGRAYLLLSYPGDAYIQFNKAEALAQADAQKAMLFYWRATALDQLGRVDTALKDWKALLDLPAGVVNPAWLQEARTHTEPTAAPTGGATLAVETLTPTP